MRRILILLLVTTAILTTCHEEQLQERVGYTSFQKQHTTLPNELFQALDLEEKVAQLVVYQFSTEDTIDHDLYRQISQNVFGGMIIDGIPLSSYLKLVDTARQLTPLPLFIGTNQSTLLNNQFTDIVPSPSALSVHAIASDSMRRHIRKLYLKQAKQLSINYNILNLTPINEDIKEYPDADYLLEQLDQSRFLTLAGSPNNELFTTGQSHSLDLKVAMQPYEDLIKKRIAGFLLDSTLFEIDTLDRLPQNFVRYDFRNKLNFNGLIAARLTPRNCLEQLLHAGVDQIITDDPEFVVRYLTKAVQSGKIARKELDEKVLKVLKAKKWMRGGLANENKVASEEEPMLFSLRASVSNVSNKNEKKEAPDYLTTEELEAHFRGENWDVYNWLLYEKSIVLVNNRNELIPFSRLYKRGFRIQQWGAKPLKDFMEQFDRYANQTSYFHPTDPGKPLEPIRKTNVTTWTTVLTLDNVEVDPEKDAAFISSVNQLARKNRVVLVNFGRPENLAPFDTTLTILQLFDRNEMTESLAAQVLFGAIPTSGVLPVTVNANFTKGMGVKMNPSRLKYALPQETGIAPEKLVSINAIAESAIDEGAMPGCQVLVAKDGKIIYSEAFGHHDYSGNDKTDISDLYDIASVTKVTATTLAAMKLYEEGLLDVNSRIKRYLNDDPDATIRNIPIKKLFIHQSGLPSAMPVAPYLLYRKKYNTRCDSFFCKERSTKYNIEVAENFYFSDQFLDQVWDKVNRLKVGSQRTYRYSDVNFALIQRILEKQSEQRLNEYLDYNFYYPLGLRYSTFLPKKHFELDKVVPTQNDTRWRRQLVHGYVHDETAALMGGIGGHAGLFSNAEDLAIILQMLLNGGEYGGKRYLQSETIKYFTTARHGNHRGLGFDKPRASGGYGYARDASLNSFGHTGFTGTCVWVDPENDLVFVFLSNRVNPYGNNRKFQKKKVRERIHQVVYDALDTYELKVPDLPELAD